MSGIDNLPSAWHLHASRRHRAQSGRNKQVPRAAGSVDTSQKELQEEEGIWTALGGTLGTENRKQ